MTDSLDNVTKALEAINETLQKIHEAIDPARVDLNKELAAAGWIYVDTTEWVSKNGVYRVRDENGFRSLSGEFAETLRLRIRQNAEDEAKTIEMLSR